MLCGKGWQAIQQDRKKDARLQGDETDLGSHDERKIIEDAL
jgi:hypothetical protein